MVDSQIVVFGMLFYVSSERKARNAKLHLIPGNPLPVGIHCSDATPTGLAEIVSDNFPVLHKPDSVLVKQKAATR